MNVKIAEPTGFCFGVKRAVDSVYEQIEKGGNIYTYGPIIHNETVVNDLNAKGVKMVNLPDELDSLEKGCVIIRSHGVSKEIYNEIERRGFEIVDLTCPFVKRIHKIVEKASEDGDTVVIIGNAGHPEVEGIRGWSGPDTYVVESQNQIEALNIDKNTKITIVSQTTFNHIKFKDLVEVFKKFWYYINVVDTICNATNERQLAAAELAGEADVMIVIGDTQSSNSKKLYEICRNKCERTYFIQTLKDLHLELPTNADLVGITAGASTPNNIIEEVQNYVRINF